MNILIHTTSCLGIAIWSRSAVISPVFIVMCDSICAYLMVGRNGRNIYVISSVWNDVKALMCQCYDWIMNMSD